MAFRSQAHFLGDFLGVPGPFSRPVGYTVEGVQRLDQLRALATEMGQRPTPGHIAALRGALGFTQSQFGERIGVDKLTVSRWERGEVRPGAASVRRLQRLRRAAGKNGIVLDA